MLSGQRIRAAREANGWSQKDLSKATGWKTDTAFRTNCLTPSAIGNYEQGKRRVDLERAQILTRVFPSYHPAYFMGAISEHESRVIVAVNAPGRPLLPSIKGQRHNGPSAT